jgi:serine/threonine-protein kinase
MTRKGPLITLLGGGALAAMLLVAGMNAASPGNNDAELAAGDTPPTGAPESGEASASPAAPDAAASPPAPPAEEPEAVTYVGNVDGDAASVAIVVTGDEATAYVCDGSAVEAWLTGAARNGELVLDGEDGSLVGSYDADQASGEVTAFDQSWTFTVEFVEQPEGLYRFADTIAGGAEVDGAWIVLPPDGRRQVGLVTVNGETAPAPELNPQTGEVVLGGSVVKVDQVGAGG